MLYSLITFAQILTHIFLLHHEILQCHPPDYSLPLGISEKKKKDIERCQIKSLDYTQILLHGHPADVNRKDHWEGEEARLLKHINVA